LITFRRLNRFENLHSPKRVFLKKSLKEELMETTNSSCKLQEDVSIDTNLDLQKGQKIIYQGDPAYVITVKPIPVIRIKNGIICGALLKDLSV